MKRNLTTLKKYDMIAHTDGSALGFGENSPHPCRAAAAAILECPEEIVRVGKYLGCVTNNVAELEAIRASLEFALDRDYTKVLVVTDSRYCEGLLTKVSGCWEFSPKKNIRLVLRVRDLVADLEKFTVLRVKGHTKGNVGNEAADQLAKECRKDRSNHFSRCDDAGECW